MRFVSLNQVVRLTVALFAVGVVPLSAQSLDLGGNSSKSVFNVQKPALNPRSLSLLDPDRFSMKQTYMMNFSSTGGNGGIMGMYLNSMEYQFNAPLVLRLKVAYQTQTGMLFGSKQMSAGLSNSNQGQLYIPSADIVYKPWKNTTFGISYRNYSAMNSSYGLNGNRYGYSGIGYGMDRYMYNLMYGYDTFDRR